MTKVSPSRGFAIELSAAMVVVVASFVGIPISTTQCKVGGTTAVGMFGGKKGIDPLFLFKIVSGWVITFFGVCLLLLCTKCKGIRMSGARNETRLNSISLRI